MENFLLSSQNGYDTNAIAKLFASDIKLIKRMFAEENSSNTTTKRVFGESKNQTLDRKFHFKAHKDQRFMKPPRPNTHFFLFKRTDKP